MKSRNILRATAVLTICLLSTFVATAQRKSKAQGRTIPPGPCHQNTRVCVQNMNKQINDLRQRLAACEGKCSQDEIQRLTTQGQRLTQQFDRKNNELTEDSNAALGDAAARRPSCSGSLAGTPRSPAVGRHP